MDMAGLQPNFSVVVVGTMNPAIHHPFWYETIGVISAAERELAVVSEGLVVSPVISQFSWAGWTIVCAGNRWEMRATSIDGFARIVDVAVAVFARLNGTPVTAFGINVDQVETKEVNAAAALCGVLQTARLGITDAATDATVTTRAKIQKARTVLTRTLALTTSANEPHLVRIANNFHHDIAIKDEQIFDLTPLLRDGAAESLAVSSAQVAAISGAFPWGAT